MNRRSPALTAASALACLAVLVPDLSTAEPLEDLAAMEKRIAEEVERRQEKDPSTAGIVAAIDWEEEQWDALLNSAYQALQTRLPEPARKSLRAAQRAWLAYRDAEQQAQAGLFAAKQGTLYQIVAAESRMRLVKHRATELASLVRAWDGDAPE